MDLILRCAFKGIILELNQYTWNETWFREELFAELKWVGEKIWQREREAEINVELKWQWKEIIINIKEINVGITLNFPVDEYSKGFLVYNDRESYKRK